MMGFAIACCVSGAVLITIAAVIGRAASGTLTGILIDTRGRYSLSQFQIVLWTTVVLSMVSGLFFARLFSGVENALSFQIPEELLLVMGISIAGTATAMAIKAGKDTMRPKNVAVSDTAHPARFAQIFLYEEGEFADKVIDLTKYQNFWITIILVVSYIATVIDDAREVSSIDAFQLPTFTDPFVVLLGITHAGYLAGKLPNPAGNPDVSVADRRLSLPP